VGNRWFKKRFDKYRLVAKLLSVPTQDAGPIPCLVFVDFLMRSSNRYGDGTSSHFEQQYGEMLHRHWPLILSEVSRQLTEPPSPPPPAPPEELMALLDPLRPREKADSFFVTPHFCRCYEKLDFDTDRAAHSWLLA
jgi:hypothetical protein